MSEKLNQQVAKLQVGYDNLTGFATENRQKQEYAHDNWHELVGICCQLLENERFRKKEEKRELPDNIHGEAFAAGISGRCADCELDKELEATIAAQAKEIERLKTCIELAWAYYETDKYADMAKEFEQALKGE